MPTKILVIGGSGFLSGTLASTALTQGCETWILTRGQRPVPDGAHALVADRKDLDACARIIADANTHWDLVVDCIGYQPEDATQDLALFRERTSHLAFVSTDFVFDPTHRNFPQSEESDHYATTGYGGDKRRCELELLDSDPGDMAWTIVRPCHIYGPGSLLGCLPDHGRDPDLLDRLRRGEALRLVGGGHFLQQPILATDLCHLLLSLRGNQNTHNQIFCAAGPNIAESRTYYQIIAEILNVELRIEEIPVDAHLKENPRAAPFLCHRIYDLTKLKASGAQAPSTSLKEGLRQHVESLTS
jgi:nucleoside-diphosphate-sugar epimerase